MNKTELLNKADELIKKANELKELANKEEDIILVPDEIRITKNMDGFSMGITNGTQELYYSYKNKTWAVDVLDGGLIIKCKLTPCRYEDIKPGDVFYRRLFNKNNFKDLPQYAIKLNNGSYQYWGNESCYNGYNTWNYYWKVESINS